MSMYPIATSTVSGSSTTTFTISNIPQTFSHLQIRGAFNCYNAPSGNSIYISFNGDAGTNYVAHYLLGSGTAASSGGSGANSGPMFFANYPTASTTSTSYFAPVVMDILDYSNPNKNKVYKSFNGYDSNTLNVQAIWIFSGMWMNTSPITSITISCAGSGNYFISGSRFDLYGLSTSSVTGA